MRGQSTADSKPGDRPQPGPRKPWHAPQFIVTDFLTTDVVCNGGSDGSPLGHLS